jgi:hypothetical protein
MKVILFGATGMVGQGLLRECLLDPTIEHVLSIVRTPTGQKHAAHRTRSQGFSRLLLHRIATHRLRHLLLLPRCHFLRHVCGRLLPRDVRHDHGRGPDSRAPQPPPRPLSSCPVQAQTAPKKAPPCGHASKAKPKMRSCAYRLKRPTCSVPLASSRCTASSREPPAIALPTPSPSPFSPC